jgi:hypothetical protein
MEKNTGARWEIAIDGVPRSYRDRKEMTIDGIEPPIVIKAWPPQAVTYETGFVGRPSAFYSSKPRRAMHVR